MAFASGAIAAPYAAFVIDARSGEVLHATNADTRLHPASLTKMMTLYIAFEAIEHGEISLDSNVKITSKAANEPPSKLGLRAGQTIKLRYLIRAAAVKSANDAATAIGIAIEGSEAAFARRMNRTAKSLGMTRTTFKNANGLTEEGHLSTARDMTTLGRHLFYDYPEYYNLFSRRSADAGMRDVPNTNSRFLEAYKGADGIKTGYTRAAGFNLVASAERGQERIIATVFGGRSTVARNAKVAELLDLGFRRAPSRVAVVKPRRPDYVGSGGTQVASAEPEVTPASAIKNGMMPAGKIIRVSVNIKQSPIPQPRPGSQQPIVDDTVLVAASEGILEALTKQAEAAPESAKLAEDTANAIAALAAVAAPEPRPSAVPQRMALLAAPAKAIPEEDDSVELAEISPSAEAEPAPPPIARIAPTPRPEHIKLAAISPVRSVPAPAPAAKALTEPEVVTRLSTSGGRQWGINVGTYGSRYQAERVLLKTALKEIGTLDEALRKVVQTKRGFNANFVGMTEESAALVCRRLQARALECSTFGPS